MVYMNAKNNLEPNALDNFHSMAEIGSTDDVSFVAQLGRPKFRYTSGDGNWHGVKRFYIRKGAKPVAADAAVDVDAIHESVDMGKPKALEQFIAWAKKAYPAHRYMLVVWNHGQGWRLQFSSDRMVRVAAARASAPPVRPSPRTVPPLGGFRAVSSDEDTGSILYNREVEDVVGRQFGKTPLNVLGFDACLMAMAETAYAFAPSVNVLAASEELEPAAGWKYSAWMAPLVAQPKMSDADLGRAIVQAYRAEYGNQYLTTMSALNLIKLRETLGGLSGFADAIMKADKVEMANLRSARSQLESYGDSGSPPLRTSVDLPALLALYAAKTSNAALRQTADRLRVAIVAHVIDNYASARSADPATRLPFGSEGVAIYLPESRAAFLEDGWRRGYSKSNRDRPVAFVTDTTWPDLVRKFAAH